MRGGEWDGEGVDGWGAFIGAGLGGGGGGGCGGGVCVYFKKKHNQCHS